jgi:hypothetical protein
MDLLEGDAVVLESGAHNDFVKALPSLTSILLDYAVAVEMP